MMFFEGAAIIKTRNNNTQKTLMTKTNTTGMQRTKRALN